MIRLFEPFKSKIQLHIRQDILQELWDKYVPVSSDAYDRISLIYLNGGAEQSDVSSQQIHVLMELIIKNISMQLHMRENPMLITADAVSRSLHYAEKYYLTQLKSISLQDYREVSRYMTYMEQAEAENRRYEYWKKDYQTVVKLEKDYQILYRFSERLRELTSVQMPKVEREQVYKLFGLMEEREYKILSELVIRREKKQIVEYIRSCSSEEYQQILEKIQIKNVLETNEKLSQEFVTERMNGQNREIVTERENGQNRETAMDRRNEWKYETAAERMNERNREIVTERMNEQNRETAMNRRNDWKYETAVERMNERNRETVTERINEQNRETAMERTNEWNHEIALERMDERNREIVTERMNERNHETIAERILEPDGESAAGLNGTEEAYRLEISNVIRERFVQAAGGMQSEMKISGRKLQEWAETKLPSGMFWESGREMLYYRLNQLDDMKMHRFYEYLCELAVEFSGMSETEYFTRQEAVGEGLLQTNENQTAFDVCHRFSVNLEAMQKEYLLEMRQHLQAVLFDTGSGDEAETETEIQELNLPSLFRSRINLIFHKESERRYPAGGADEVRDRNEQETTGIQEPTAGKERMTVPAVLNEQEALSEIRLLWKEIYQTQQDTEIRLKEQKGEIIEKEFQSVDRYRDILDIGTMFPDAPRLEEASELPPQKYLRELLRHKYRELSLSDREVHKLQEWSRVLLLNAEYLEYEGREDTEAFQNVWKDIIQHTEGEPQEAAVFRKLAAQINAGGILENVHIIYKETVLADHTIQELISCIRQMDEGQYQVFVKVLSDIIWVEQQTIGTLTEKDFIRRESPEEGKFSDVEKIFRTDYGAGMTDEEVQELRSWSEALIKAQEAGGSEEMTGRSSEVKQDEPDFFSEGMQNMQTEIIRYHIQQAKDRSELERLIEQVNHYTKEEVRLTYREEYLGNPVIKKMVRYIQQLDEEQYPLLIRQMSEMLRLCQLTASREMIKTEQTALYQMSENRIIERRELQEEKLYEIYPKLSQHIQEYEVLRRNEYGVKLRRFAADPRYRELLSVLIFRENLQSGSAGTEQISMGGEINGLHAGTKQQKSVHRKDESQRREFQEPDNPGAGYQSSDSSRAEYRSPDSSRVEFRRQDNPGAEYRSLDNPGAEYRRPDNQGTEYRNPDNQRAEYRSLDNPGAEYRRPDNQRTDFKQYRSVQQLTHAEPVRQIQEGRRGPELRIQEDQIRMKSVQEQMEVRIKNMEQQLKQVKISTTGEEDVRAAAEKIKKLLHEELHIEKLRRGLT